MKPATRKLWREADTLADLADLTARWLERDLDEHPSYPDPDSETGELVPTLARLNRAGFLTVDSQPASIDTLDGVVCRQRAAVTLLVPGPGDTGAPRAHLLRDYGTTSLGCTRNGSEPWRIRRAEGDEELRMDMIGAYLPGSVTEDAAYLYDSEAVRYLEHASAPHKYDFSLCWPVTTEDGECITHMGGGLNRTALKTEILPGVSPAARAQLVNAYQFTLIDPVYGRNDLLWPLLDAVAAAAG